MLVGSAGRHLVNAEIRCRGERCTHAVRCSHMACLCLRLQPDRLFTYVCVKGEREKRGGGGGDRGVVGGGGGGG